MAGPTREFPEGMLDEHDEGALVIEVGIDQSKIIVNFGASVRWIGLNVDGAEQFANTILSKVAKIRGVKS